jgi:hypothetical protein
MPITSENDIVSALWSGRQEYVLDKYISSLSTIGQMGSYWIVGRHPFAGTTPTTAAVCTRSLTGAIPFTPATSGKYLYLLAIEFWTAFNGGQGAGGIFDRIVHMGGLSGTNTGVQSVSTPTLPTDRGIASNYSDLGWYLEWYSATGSTPVTCTINYVNQSSASKSTTVAIPASPAASRLIQFSPLAGDWISSVTSIQLSGTTGTAGNFGVTALRKVVPVMCVSLFLRSFQDYTNLALTRVFDTSCLMLAMIDTANSFDAELKLIFGQN